MREYDQFYSITDGKDLPDEIYEYTPKDDTVDNHIKVPNKEGFVDEAPEFNEYVKPYAEQPTQTTYKVDDGVWTFVGYDVGAYTEYSDPCSILTFSATFLVNFHFPVYQAFHIS